jgi:hypothetical protein
MLGWSLNGSHAWPQNGHRLSDNRYIITANLVHRPVGRSGVKSKKMPPGWSRVVK